MTDNLIKISFTQIDMFRQCARKWWFKFRMGIKDTAFQEGTKTLIFGKVWHRVVECYHKGVPIIQICNMIEAEDKLNVDYKKLMMDMFMNYINFNISCEGDLYIPISGGKLIKDQGYSFLFEEDFEEWSFIHLGVMITGVIDLAFAKDGVAWVVDHKSTDKPYDETKMHLSLQAQLYHMVVSRLMPGTQVNFLWNINEKHGGKGGKILAGNRFRIQREPIYGMSVRDTHDEMEYHIQNMLRTDRYPGKSESFHCAWCAYKDICMVGSNEVKAYNYIESCLKGVQVDGV